MGRRSSPEHGDATGAKYFFQESNIIDVVVLNSDHCFILQALHLPRKFIGLENVGHLLSDNMRHVFEMLCEERFEFHLFSIFQHSSTCLGFIPVDRKLKNDPWNFAMLH